MARVFYEHVTKRFGDVVAVNDLTLEIPLVLVSGSHVVCAGYMKGTNTGPLVSPEGEMPPTGRRVNIRMAFILRVTPTGLIEEDQTYFDEAEFLKQLGLG